MNPHASSQASGTTPPPSASARVAPSDTQATFSHNISSFSDFSQFEPFDVYQSEAVLRNDDQAADQPSTVNAATASHPSPSPPAGLSIDASYTAYDPPQHLGGHASMHARDSLVFDEALGAYTKTSPGSAAQTLNPVASSSSTLGQATAEPQPYSTYDSGYGATTAPPSATSYFSGGQNLGRRLSNMLSARRMSARRSDKPYVTIPEHGSDNIDMSSLVQNAAPAGHSPSGRSPSGRSPSGPKKAYAPLDEMDEEAEMGAGLGANIDISSFSGIANAQDLKEIHAQEASGKLTLGLGAGFGPSTQLKESDLFSAASAGGAATPISPTASLARSFSRGWPGSGAGNAPLSPSPLSRPGSLRGLARQSTVKALAQNEANKRGEIVEVIMEEDEDLGAAAHVEGVDLSFVAGDQDVGQPRPLSMAMADRQRTGMAKRSTHVFYPQPNWRPFAMRWPYLTGLIVLSVGLGVAQELIYRMSLERPLATFHTPSEIDPAIYFSIRYVPTLIAVTFGVLWQVTDFEVKRLEAFYQLSRENGAVADESINVDYVTYIAVLRPFRALYCGHYAVAVSALVSLLAVSLVPTLSAASIVLTPDRETRISYPQGLKTIVIHAKYSRILTSVFLVIAALGLVLFWLLHRRRSGLQSDVKGIAGLASMAVVSHIMTDFKGTDLASHEDIHRQLAERRYVLRNASLAPDDDHPVSLAERERYRDFDSHMSQNPHPLMLRPAGCIPYICGIVLFAVLIPVVLFTPANALTDKAPWVLTALAVSIKLGWGGLETAVRVMEPYYLLWKRHAPAKTLLLDYTAMPFVLVAVEALRNRHMLMLHVGFATVLTELLTVLVTSLATVEGHNFIGKNLGATDSGADSGEETAASFWATLGLAMFILVYMSVVAAVVFVRRRTPFLPRQPNTIASVLAYIHQSKMLWNFANMSKMSNSEMLRKLEADGHTYGLGWFTGRDGKRHCGVDQEELMSSYKLGYDYTRSNQPWQETETWL